MLEPGLGMGSLTAEPTLLPAADTDVKPKLMESQEQWGMGLLPRSICLCLSLYSTSSFLEIKKKKNFNNYILPVRNYLRKFLVEPLEEKQKLCLQVF